MTAKEELARKMAAMMTPAMKEQALKQFYTKNKDHPQLKELLIKMKEMLGYTGTYDPMENEGQ